MMENYPSQHQQHQHQLQPVVHREACDECHQRKVRCVTSNGACQNCILWGKSCIFSPRSSMGRPRKRKAAKSLSTTALRTLSTTAAGSFDSNVSSATQQDPQASSSSSSTSHGSQFGVPTAADYLPTPPFNSDCGTDYLPQTTLNQFAVHDADFSVMLGTDWHPMTEKGNTNSNTNNNTNSNTNNNTSSNHRSPPFMASLGARSLSDTVTVFSTMLFDLRRQRDRLYSKDLASITLDASSSQDTHEIFKQVSSFCEVTHRTFGEMAPTTGQAPLPETQSMIHLVIMTISTALDIYGLQVRSSESALPNPQQQQRQSTTTTNPSRLPLILHLTTMDYHLARFQWILSRVLLLFPFIAGSTQNPMSAPISHDDGPAEELKKSQTETSQIRSRISEEVEKLKCARDNP